MAKQGSAIHGGIWAIIILLIVSLVGYVTGKVEDSRAAVEAAGSYNVAFMVCYISMVAAFGLGLILCIMQLCGSRESLDAALECTRKLISRQTEIEAILTNVNENQLLSDAIKAIAFRRKDRSVLSDAIQQDMRAEQWESANWLIDQLESRFGGTLEAEKLRKEMADRKISTLQEKIDMIINQIESYWVINHYHEAQQMEDELLELYPDNDHVLAVKGQTESRLQAHKKELLERLNKASHSNDLDQSIEILKLLDNYISPTEAAALQETARGIYKERLHNMGVQFSLFVTEKSWDHALKLGLEIIHEYPNSRMAQEVRDKMDVLKKRASLSDE